MTPSANILDPDWDSGPSIEDMSDCQWGAKGWFNGNDDTSWMNTFLWHHSGLHWFGCHMTLPSQQATERWPSAATIRVTSYPASLIQRSEGIYPNIVMDFVDTILGWTYKLRKKCFNSVESSSGISLNFVRRKHWFWELQIRSNPSQKPSSQNSILR